MTPFGAQVGPMSGKRDYYDVLGISKDASEDQIKQSFRSLARKSVSYTHLTLPTKA